MDTNPELVLIISGKRKSGKDYVSSLIINSIGDLSCSSIQLSGPLKKQYAEENNLDFVKLSDSSKYKEKFRKDMIKFGEEKRRQDSGYFCRLATSIENLNKVWIVTDARRKTDIDYFKDNYKDRTYTVRVCAEDAVRESRGFIHTPGVDDAESECGLDEGITWDYVVKNNGTQEQLKSAIKPLIDIIKNKILDVA